MYCCHCGKKFNEHALEKKHSSYEVKDANGNLLEVDTDAKVMYVCPQCGHLTHDDLSQEELKSLSQAAHSQLQRGANSFAKGMAMNLLGLIIGILALSFLLLSLVNDGNGGKMVNTGKSTFIVFVVMAIVAVILLAVGIYSTVIGISKRTMYTKLLKDLNNKTFVQ